MRAIPLLFIIAPLLCGQNSGARTTPPAVQLVSPRGVPRGITTELTVEGLNLAGSKTIYFSRPGLSARITNISEIPDAPEPVVLGDGGLPSSIDRGPLPPRYRVTIAVDVAAEAETGTVKFRLLTALGTTATGEILIEPYYGESPDREPNNGVDTAFETYAPTILVGAISYPGDVDYFKLHAAAGERLAFDDGGQSLGSLLDPVITILKENGQIVCEHRRRAVQHSLSFEHVFKETGVYFIKVSDAQESGGGERFYRIRIGKFALPAPSYQLSRNDPEVESVAGNAGPLRAQPVSVPVAIHGRLLAPAEGLPAENDFRFHAKKGEHFVLEVSASRLGSDLDSLLEILDTHGNPVERATLQAVKQLSTSILERDSVNPGIYLSTLDSLSVGDYLLIGEELGRIDDLPAQFCQPVIFSSLNGKRVAYFDTTAQVHGIDEPVYKVRMVPAGSHLANNSLPVFHLNYRNDDGGPEFGKDSLLHFTAPADSDYVARIRDITGAGGATYTYNLSIRHPRPDFELSVTPNNPNVPSGGSIPLTVTAVRKDGFDGPIEVALQSLPAGLRAATGTIPPGQVTTTLSITAGRDAALAEPARMQVIGSSTIEGKAVTHAAEAADDLALISVVPTADISLATETRQLSFLPGERQEVTIKLERRNGFDGRVLLEFRNLPPGVRVIDVGLSGVVLERQESRRTVALEAARDAMPVRQPVYVSGRIETRSPLQNSFAAQPILLNVNAR